MMRAETSVGQDVGFVIFRLSNGLAAGYVHQTTAPERLRALFHPKSPFRRPFEEKALVMKTPIHAIAGGLFAAVAIPGCGGAASQSTTMTMPAPAQVTTAGAPTPKSKNNAA